MMNISVKESMQTLHEKLVALSCVCVKKKYGQVFTEC